MTIETHIVIDPTYHEGEKLYEVLTGTYQECQDFIRRNGDMYDIIPKL